MHLIPRAYDRLKDLKADQTWDQSDFFRTIVPVPAGDQRVGIVDHKLAPFIEDLHKGFRGAKFVWLVRDGRDFVASAVARGWYTDHERVDPPNTWAAYRICADVIGEMGKDEWQQLSAFERCCWYWAWWNRVIYKGLHTVATEDWRIFTLEGLAGQSDELGRLQRFLGLGDIDMPRLWHTNKGKGPSRKWSVWTANESASFESLCGELMDQLYPGWR
jgi:hypothetical protein